MFVLRSKEKERNKFRSVQGNKQEGIIFEHATNKSITERRLWIRVACKIYRRDSVMVLRLGNVKGYIEGTEKRKKKTEECDIARSLYGLLI